MQVEGQWLALMGNRYQARQPIDNGSMAQPKPCIALAADLQKYSLLLKAKGALGRLPTIEILEVLLASSRVDWSWQPVRPNWGVQSRILIHILHKQCRADGGPVVDPRTSVTVPTSPAPVLFSQV